MKTTDIELQSISNPRNEAHMELRQEMSFDLNLMGFECGHALMLVENECVESVTFEILDNRSRPLNVRVKRYVDNPNWFVVGDDDYHHGLSAYELERLLGDYGVGKHRELTSWKKVWAVSSGYSKVSNRPHGGFSYYSDKSLAFKHAMDYKCTVFCILTHDSNTTTSDGGKLESATKFEYDNARVSSSFRIVVEPICFGNNVR